MTVANAEALLSEGIRFDIDKGEVLSRWAVVIYNLHLRICTDVNIWNVKNVRRCRLPVPSPLDRVDIGKQGREQISPMLPPYLV